MEKKTILIKTLLANTLVIILSWICVKNNSISALNIIFLMISFSLIFISYFISAILDMNEMLKKLVVSSLFLEYYIAFDLLVYPGTNEKILYIKSIIQAVPFLYIEDSLVFILSKGRARCRWFRISLYLFIAICGVIYTLLDKELFFKAVYILNLLVLLYPTIIVLINIDRLKKYWKISFSHLSILCLGNLIFTIIVLTYKSNRNYDIYLYLSVCVIGILISLVHSTRRKTLSIVSEGRWTDFRIIVVSLLILVYTLIREGVFLNAIITTYGITIEIAMFNILFDYRRIYEENIPSARISSVLSKSQFHKMNSIDSPLRKMLFMGAERIKMEELLRDRVADFLHDEVLQDSILIKKEIKEKYGSDGDKILNLIDSQIDSIRGEIDLFKPRIDRKIPISKSIFFMMNRIREKNKNSNILVDFFCDDDLFLPSPYGSLVYRIISELVVNVYKHMKGSYSEVHLDIVENNIEILVKNHDDEVFSVDTSENKIGGRVLKIIEKEVYIFDGEFEIKFEDGEEPKTVISVVVSIRRRVVDEDIVSRRS